MAISLTYGEILNQYNKILQYILSGKIKDAFDNMRIFLNYCRNKDLSIQLDNYFQTYYYMLKYSFELSDDPEKDKVYEKLRKSLIELLDDAKEDIILHNKLLSYYNIKEQILYKEQLTAEESKLLVENLEFEGEIKGILEKEIKYKFESEYKKIINKIFKHLWLSDDYKEAEIELVSKIIKAKNIPWYDKSIVISALTLSLLRHFDSNKVMLLIDAYESGENQVWQRALIGWVISLLYYDKRLIFYPEIVNRLKAMQGDRVLEKQIEMVIVQFIKARETEKITKKIQEEIIPEMIKIKDKLDDKLDLEDLSSFKGLYEKNPEWENFFKDSPDIYKKMEEFYNLQIEGADVFLGAFGMLKRFEFFNEISNWFLPFYKENTEVINALNDIKESIDVNKFIESMEKTIFLCNSDKYSFCLNIKYLPSVQKSMITELFNMEMNAMEEMTQSDGNIDPDLQNKVIIRQYFQDLYRFFKLYPLKHEFVDIFNIDFNLVDSLFLNVAIDSKEILRNLAEFFFEKNYYSEALQLFNRGMTKSDDIELLEKIGYCYQQLGDFKTALDYYLKAELLGNNKSWLYNKIAWCYRKLKNYDKAIEYYKELEKKNPENTQLQVLIGNTYMEMENYELALQYFYKAEYNEPNNFKILRPIAWCSFVTGKLSDAEKYYSKIVENEANANKYDHLNYAHVLWCKGNKMDAIKNYKLALKKSEFDFNWFSNALEDDKKYLLSYNINPLDIPLMIDYMKLMQM